MYWWFSAMPTLSEILEMNFRTSGKSCRLIVKEQDSNQMPLIIRHATLRRYFIILSLFFIWKIRISLIYQYYEVVTGDKWEINVRLFWKLKVPYKCYLLSMCICPHMHFRTCGYFNGREVRSSQYRSKQTPGFGSEFLSDSSLHQLSTDFSALP